MRPLHRLEPPAGSITVITTRRGQQRPSTDADTESTSDWSAVDCEMIAELQPEGEETIALSVVVVTYEEADQIRDCLESVFTACRDVPEYEVILVDSGSTDGTVEHAVEFPITVLSIPESGPRTPGAGRYVGTQIARGESILFVDGDMTLSPDWLPAATDCLHSEGVAGVDGELAAPGASHDDSAGDSLTVDAIRGVALYDATALRSVGGFDPFLRGLEDIHLGYLLTMAGYELRRLSLVAATHPESDAVREPLRRWRRGYTVGPGQVLRRSVGSPSLLVRYVRRFNYRFATLAWLCVGLTTPLVGPLALLAWVCASAAGGVGLVSRLGPADGFEFAAEKLLGIAGIALGFVDSPRSRSAYPLEAVTVVAEGPIHSGVPRSAGL